MNARVGPRLPAGALLLALVWPALAAPLAWLAPWTVQLDQNMVDGAGARQRAFGVSATIDGQIVDLDADIALARTEALVLAADSLAVARVDFERPFSLAGSPNGWTLSLLGLLSGSLAIATDPGALSEVSIFGRAHVFDDKGNLVGPSIAVTEDRKLVGVTPFALFAATDSVFLENGNYLIKGRLTANAVSLAAAAPIPPVLAQSLFFNGGWEVSLDAREAPEPSTLLLVLAAGAATALRRAPAFRVSG